MKHLFKTLIWVGTGIFLLFSQGAMGQEGTITLLSGGEKLTLLHNSELIPPRLPHQDSTPFGQLKTQALKTNDRVMALYPGSTQQQPIPKDDDGLVALMNASGYEASGLGGYELSLAEPDFLSHLQQARFPYLAANLQINSDSALADVVLPFETVSIEDLRAGSLGGWMYPGLLIQYDGLEVCVFGLVDQALQPQLSNPDFTLSDPMEAAQAMVTTCEENDSQLIVSLIHLTDVARLDSAIKQQVPGIDVFVVGGSNERFDPEQNPAAHLMQTPKGLSLSVQTNVGRNLAGALDLTISSNRIFEFSYRQVSLGGAGAMFGGWMLPLMLGLGALALLGFILFKGQ